VKYYFLILIPVTLCGQSKTDSLQALSDERILNVYTLTANSAALWLLPLPDYGRVYGNGAKVSSDFKKPLEPGSITALAAGAEGWKKQKKMGYRGSFHYEKRFDKDLKWTDERDAYNGNPFLWADSSSGNWDKDHIDARVDVSASPFRNALLSGLHLDYQVGTGARTNDPKPFYRYRSIAVQPGFLFKLSESSQAGITGGGTFILENNELGYYNRGTNNVLLYRLRGYGTYSRVPFVSGERNRKGQVWNAGAHWEKQVAGYVMLLYASAQTRKEEVSEGIAKPEMIGKFTEVKWNTGVFISKGNVNRGHSFLLKVNSADGKGRDQVYQAENAAYSRHTVNGNFQWWGYRSKSRTLIKTGFLPALLSYSQSDKASGSRFSVNTLGGKAEGLVRKYFTRGKQLEVVPGLAYFHVLKNTCLAPNNNVVLREIVLKNYEFMAEPSISASIRIRWSRFSPEGGHSIFVDTDHIRSLKESHRTICRMGYSFLF